MLSLEGLGLAEIQAAAAGVELPGLLLHGAFPELWSQPAIKTGDFQRSYVNTYLERDQRSLQQVGNLLQFERFLRACALRSGQLLNRAELARDGGPLPGVPRTTPLPPGQRRRSHAPDRTDQKLVACTAHALALRW